MSKSKFDTEYLKWLQQLDAEDDGTVWEEIQGELDFVETWDYISCELDRIYLPIRRTGAKSYVKIISVAAAVILLMLASVNYFNEHVNQPPVNSIKISAEEKLIEKDINTTSEIKQEVHTEDLVQKSSLIPGPVPRSAQEISSYQTEVKSIAFSEKKENEDSLESVEEYGRAGIQKQQFEINNLLVSNAGELSALIISPDLGLTGSGRTSGPFLRIAEVGVVYGYKNTWLLNYETKNGLDPKKLGNTLLTFHQDMGLLSTIAIKDHQFIGLEFLWRSETGQKYQQYINASYVDRNINLNYVKLQAYYIWDHRNIPGQTIIGGYIAKLRLAEEVQGMVTFNVSEKYRNSAYGLLLGYQFNMPLKNRMFISPGFRVSYDFINIFESDAGTVNPFKKTNNFTAGINISISYRLFQ